MNVAVIPAWNEEATIASVVHAARSSRSIDRVVVVDNASTDATAYAATAAGALVLPEQRKGKGEAMRAGVLGATEPGDVVVFLDADLVGLTPAHIESLVEPVVAGDADMACGLFDRGPRSNSVYLNALPVLTGQRALRRDLFCALDLEDIRGYRVEAALNSLVAQQKLTRVDEVLPGLWHRTKEEKFSNPVAGFAHKVAMLTTAVWSYASFLVRRRILQPAGSG